MIRPLACSLILVLMLRSDGVSKLPLIVVALCVAAAAQSPSQPTASPARETVQPDLASVVQRLQAAQSQVRPDRAYLVTREYRLLDTHSSRVSSQVLAQVQYFPPERKTYVIQTRTGSSRGEQVVKRILDHESQMTRRSSQTSAAALSEENYTFTYLGSDSIDGKDCHVLGLQPKRKENELIVGRAWVDKNTFLVRRIEGDVAKTPSWMLKKVHVRLDFSDVSGTWLQTGMEAIADVRFIGSQTLQSRTLDYRVTNEVAQIPPKRSLHVRRSIPAELVLSPRTVQR
jgi:hypothetical protein